MRELVFCLEEASARRFLEGVVSRVNQQNVPVRYIVFEGKQDLEGSLERRIKGYRNPDAIFIIMRDQDGAPDCKVIKQKLKKICVKAGRSEAVVRIACRELEAFYWGDLAAVERALGVSGLRKLSTKAQFRDSDSIVNPARELNTATKGLYQKVLGSEMIGREISVDHCTSRSFQALRDSVLAVIG